MPYHLPQYMVTGYISILENIGMTEKARLCKDFTGFYFNQLLIEELKQENPTMYKVYKAVTEHEQTTNEIKDKAKVCQKTAENYLKLLTSSGLVKCDKIEWRGRHKYMFMWSLP